LENIVRVLAPFFLVLLTSPLWGQSDTGELRLKVTDPHGLPLPSTVSLESDANQVRKTMTTDAAGLLDAELLPFGIYQVTVLHSGFQPAVQTVNIHSALPITYELRLNVATAATVVDVHDSSTLIDPERAGSVNRMGKSMIDGRQGSLPGRSVIDLVNSQPGWLYEGNAVLHPRGSEYQTQYVVDGIPLTDNRSPGSNVQAGAEDIQSIGIYTAGIPAEYGRKMGGVIEVSTLKDPRQGLHGTTELYGGSFSTADGYAMAQYGWGKNSASLSATGTHTDWYQNPPVLDNFTNNGTTGDFAGAYERDFSDNDRLTLTARHGLARFRVPNEFVQQQAGQRQDRDTLETIGSASYQHIVSPKLLGALHLMVRDDTTNLSSNALATPIIAGQDRGYRESYLKATVTADHGMQEWKAGAEADFIDIHEQFNYTITDPTQFDPGTPGSFQFSQRGRDREQAVFIENNLHFHRWAVAAGIRWDHSKLVVDRNAWSPRLAVSRYFSKYDFITHFSYDRVFQTPAFENILLSSSPAVVSLDPEVLRIPVEPSHGNYYEVGFTKGFAGQLRLDGNYFLREVNNFADDDQLLDTAISFPIAFRKAHIYGAEAKLDLPHWGRLSGFASYSYLVGSAYLPVTGGLFLGDEATRALQQRAGRFWITQDQRNTLRTRLRYQLVPRAWVAAGSEYGSGLPVDFTGTYEEAVGQYGQALIDRVDLRNGRVKPSLAINASAGADLLRTDKLVMQAQVDGQSLNNRINLIDFAGLFSGNAVAPPRSWDARLRLSF
jgi:hypothetical protein